MFECAYYIYKLSLNITPYSHTLLGLVVYQANITNNDKNNKWKIQTAQQIGTWGNLLIDNIQILLKNNGNVYQTIF